MNFTKEAVNNLVDYLKNELFDSFKDLKNEYLETEEYKQLVSEQEDKLLDYEDLANEMAELVKDEENLKKLTINIDDFYFVKDKEKGYMKMNGDIHTAAIIRVKNDKLRFDWDAKVEVERKLLAIISTLDDTTSFDKVVEIVNSKIDLKELLFIK